MFRPEKDYFSYEGARILKRVIEQVHARNGLFPNVEMVKQYSTKDERPIYVIRSDLAFDEKGYPYVKRFQ